ncbi:hypothetical protein F3Y22_tig00110328pilonHSYRG00696 [Hibiscus syriacus]|uniref:Protein kinase domain-containing protein n=1 Tax=Hibiscus syriacus TaxID=106335 RepID=A0A6A3B2L2_HIBSY|nr:hypothetical protein F3Y22_tig00110328pilonHSYRG00696 [Hibiscus syriacus]
MISSGITTSRSVSRFAMILVFLFNIDISQKMVAIAVIQNGNCVMAIVTIATNQTKQLERSYVKKTGHGSLNILIWEKSRRTVEHDRIWVPCCCNWLQKIQKATQGFHEEIIGGGGVVYKGVLPDQQIDAMKTKQGKHKLLVYEHMENGSSADSLTSNSLYWKKRFDNEVGTRKGLAYLHEERLEWVLHCDVKPHNILLDYTCQPKVSDFGLSKLLNRDSPKGWRFSKFRSRPIQDSWQQMLED